MGSSWERNCTVAQNDPLRRRMKGLRIKNRKDWENEIEHRGIFLFLKEILKKFSSLLINWNIYKRRNVDGNISKLFPSKLFLLPAEFVTKTILLCLLQNVHEWADFTIFCATHFGINWTLFVSLALLLFGDRIFYSLAVIQLRSSRSLVDWFFFGKVPRTSAQDFIIIKLWVRHKSRSIGKMIW